MHRPSRGSSHQFKRAEKPIIGRPLWGISSSGVASRNSVGRSSTASTRYESPTASATFTTSATLTSAPKTPQNEQMSQGSGRTAGSGRGKAAPVITVPASDKDAASSFASDTDSMDLMKSEGGSEVWTGRGEAQVDSVMAKLQNLMNMAQEQLEKTGRRASVQREGRRASHDPGRRTSRRPSQIECKKISQTTTPTGGSQPQLQVPQYGSERRSSVESSGTLMCDMLDMVTEDLALLTEDLAFLTSDPDSRILELEELLEKEEASTKAAREEILRLLSILSEKEAENERLKLEREAAMTVKEIRTTLDPSAVQVQMLREELDLLRVQQSELACKQQRNALAFETACARSGLSSCVISAHGSIKVPCDTSSCFVSAHGSIKVPCDKIEEDKASVPPAETTDTLPAQTTEPAEATKVVEEIEKPVGYPLIESKRVSQASEVISLGSTALLGSLTLANSTGSLSAVAASPSVVARETVPPKATVLPVTSGAPPGSLASQYMQTLRQNGSHRFASPVPSQSYVPQSSRTSLASQCSRAQSPPRVVQVSTSCSRASSPYRSVTSSSLPLLPMCGSPPIDFRSLSRPDSPRAACSSEATSFHQPAISTVAPPMGVTSSFTPQDLSVGTQSPQVLPAEHLEATQCGTVVRSNTSRALRWKLKWVLE